MRSVPNQFPKPLFIRQNHRVRNFVYKHDYRSKTRQLRKVGHGTTGLEHFQEQLTPGGWFMEHLMVIKVGYSPVLRNRNSSFQVNRNLTRLQTQNDFQTKWIFTGTGEAKIGGPPGLLASQPSQVSELQFPKRLTLKNEVGGL